MRPPLQPKRRPTGTAIADAKPSAKIGSAVSTPAPNGESASERCSAGSTSPRVKSAGRRFNVAATMTSGKYQRSAAFTDD